MAEGPSDRSAPTATDAGDLLQLRRSDLAAALAVYRRESKSRSGLWLLIFGLAGFPAAFAFSMLAERHHWSDAWAPFVLIGMFIPLFAALVILVRRQRALLARVQLSCPACGAPFLDVSFGQAASRADFAIASGCCQKCGDEVLARDVQ